jgi:hypothetical protein
VNVVKNISTGLHYIGLRGALFIVFSGFTLLTNLRIAAHNHYSISSLLFTNECGQTGTDRLKSITGLQ